MQGILYRPIGGHYALPDQIWTFAHAGMLADGLFCLRPDLEVMIPILTAR